MSHFGLDIGASSIKIAQIVREQSGMKLVKVGLANNPVGSVKMNSDMEMVTIAETIKKLISDIGLDTRETAIALPESQVYSSLIELPPMAEDQLEQAVSWEAENVIPRPLNEVSYSWKIVEDNDTSHKDKVNKILIVASPLGLIEKYNKLAKLANIDNRLIETETISIGRVLKVTHPVKDYVAMLQIGYDSTDVAIYYAGELLQSRSLPSAGEALTRGVSTNLNMDHQESEEYKKAYGLSKQLEGKVASSLVPVLDNIALEVKKTISNFEAKDDCHIKLILLVGGSVLMPGLAEYFTAKLGVEVQISDPTTAINIAPSVLAEVKKQFPVLIVAFGLAMAEM